MPFQRRFSNGASRENDVARSLQRDCRGARSFGSSTAHRSGCADVLFEEWFAAGLADGFVVHARLIFLASFERISSNLSLPDCSGEVFFSDEIMQVRYFT